MASPSVPLSLKFNPRLIRTFVNRLPFFTRVILFLDIFLYLLSRFVPSLVQASVLLPSAVSFTQAHRLNSFPLIHGNFIQAILSLTALVPLLDRFESEHGSLVSLALFAGPFSTVPGVLYILIDHVIFRADDTVSGASIWVFLLLGCEAVKIYRSNPAFSLAGVQIPTWTIAFVAIFFLNFLMPGTGLVGHLCGAVVGYGFELGYLKFLVPPERILRWIEGKLNLLSRLPHYVSVDQKTYGRYGVLPTREVNETPLARSFFIPSQRQS